MFFFFGFFWFFLLGCQEGRQISVISRTDPLTHPAAVRQPGQEYLFPSFIASPVALALGGTTPEGLTDV